MNWYTNSRLLLKELDPTDCKIFNQNINERIVLNRTNNIIMALSVILIDGIFKSKKKTNKLHSL